MNSTKMSSIEPNTGMEIPGADVSGTETTNPDAKYSGAVIRAYGGIDTIQAKSAAIAAKAEATKTTVVGAASTAVDVNKQEAMLPGQLNQAAMEARGKQPFEIAKLKAAQEIQHGDAAEAGHL